MSTDKEQVTNDDVESKEEVPNFLDMPDDEAKAYDPSKLDALVAGKAGENDGKSTSTDGTTNTDATNADATDDESESDDDKSKEPGDANTDDTSSDGSAVSGGVKDKAEVGDQAKDGTEGSKSDAQIDYKAEMERLLVPFKANGRTVQVNSVDDAISLMQMGANYNKKMQGLKPNMKFLKMLESNGLLDESKLSFLIDLDKRNPDAINKLVAESGVDPMDIDTTKAGSYQAKTYAVDERELELDSVLSDLKDSEHYSRTLDVVANKWDAKSKGIISSNPEILKIIHNHVRDGHYDLIEQAMENERMLGRLQGISDIDAYKQIGDALHAKGAFNHLGKATGNSEQTTQGTKAQVGNTSKKSNTVDQAEIDARKRAAGSTKTAVPSKKLPADFNPLNLSDEEFAKMDKKLFK